MAETESPDLLSQETEDDRKLAALFETLSPEERQQFLQRLELGTINESQHAPEQSQDQTPAELPLSHDFQPFPPVTRPATPPSPSGLDIKHLPREEVKRPSPSRPKPSTRPSTRPSTSRPATHVASPVSPPPSEPTGQDLKEMLLDVKNEFKQEGTTNILDEMINSLDQEIKRSPLPANASLNLQLNRDVFDS